MKKYLSFFLVSLAMLGFATQINAATACDLPVQKAYKTANSNSVYYVTEDCTKRAFLRSDVFFTYFDSWSEVKTDSRISQIPNDPLGFMPSGPKYDPKYGALVKTVSDPRVYLLLGNEKKWITSESVFSELKYEWYWIEDVDARLLDKYVPGGEISDTNTHPNFTLVKFGDDPSIYRVSPDPNGGNAQQILHIKNENVFNQLGFRFDRIVELGEEDKGKYVVGDPLDEDDLVGNLYGDSVSDPFVDDPFVNDPFGDDFEQTLYDEGDLFAEDENYFLDEFGDAALSTHELDALYDELFPDSSIDVETFVDGFLSGECPVGTTEVGDQCEIALSLQFECITQAECDQKEADYDKKFDDFFSGIEGLLSSIEDEYYGDGGGFEQELNDFAEQKGTEDENVIATYSVSRDSLTEKKLGQAANNYSTLAIDNTKHQQMFALFATLIPQESRTAVIRFEVYTDGLDETLGYVYNVSGRSWILGIDIRDSFTQSGSMNKKDLIHTLIHEYAHVLTLGGGQVDNSIEEEDCVTYFVEEGCTDSNSYIYGFYNNFWQGKEPAGKFDQVDPREFVTEYAATSMEEDLAETFTKFVISSSVPTGNTVADQKVKFLYGFAELVELRDEIRGGLAKAQLSF